MSKLISENPKWAKFRLFAIFFLFADTEKRYVRMPGLDAAASLC